MKKYKKLIIYSFIILFVAFIIFYSYPRKLYSECSGIIYRLGDSNYSEDIKIIIDGYYSKGLFTGDIFEGTITNGEKKLTKNNIVLMRM